MELVIFARPAVADLLKSGFIEGRLHTDIAGKKLQRNLAMQKKFSQSVSVPSYIIVDPKTETMIARKRGVISEKDFVKFLEIRK